MPRGSGNTPANFGASPAQREAVGLLRTIAASPLIPPHFTGYGRFVNTNHGANLLIGVSHFHQSRI